MTSNAFWTKKVKMQQQQKNNADTKVLVRAENRTRDILHHSLVQYLQTIEITERIIFKSSYLTDSTLCLTGRKIYKKPNLRSTIFHQSRFPCNIRYQVFQQINDAHTYVVQQCCIRQTTLIVTSTPNNVCACTFLPLKQSHITVSQGIYLQSFTLFVFYKVLLKLFKMVFNLSHQFIIFN